MKQEIILSIFVFQIFGGASGIRISEKKCQDYQAIASSVSFNRNIDYFSESADPKEFPFMAKVYLHKNNSHYINGLLISENFVLTVEYNDEINFSNEPFVVLGDYVDRIRKKQQRINIIQYTTTPQDHLTLLKLKASVIFNQYVRPICLSQPDVSITQSLTEIGWGIKHMLRKEKMDLLANVMCNETHLYGTEGTYLCVSRKEIDCENNWWNIYRVEHLYIYGCALLNGHREESHSNELVGIKAKTNHFSCEIEHPEEFVRISSYIDWIENNVWLSNSGVAGANNLTFSAYIILLLQVIYI